MTTRGPSDHSRGVASVVCAAFDADGDAAIATLQDRLRELGVRVPREPAHRPHITLSAAAAEPDEVAPVAAAIARDHAAVSVRLDRIGTFARGSIVWLGPSGTELAGLQRDVHTALGAWPRAFGEHVDPDRWVPHCTLARRAPRGVAVRLRDGFTPLTVRVSALATIVVGGRGDHALTPLVPR